MIGYLGHYFLHIRLLLEPKSKDIRLDGWTLVSWTLTVVAQ